MATDTPTPAAPVAAPAPVVTVADVLAARQAEWGRYRANKLIQIDGVNAFGAGDPVPTSHVERGVVSASDVDLTQKG